MHICAFSCNRIFNFYKKGKLFNELPKILEFFGVKFFSCLPIFPFFGVFGVKRSVTLIPMLPPIGGGPKTRYMKSIFKSEIALKGGGVTEGLVTE